MDRCTSWSFVAFCPPVLVSARTHTTMRCLLQPPFFCLPRCFLFFLKINADVRSRPRNPPVPVEQAQGGRAAPVDLISGDNTTTTTTTTTTTVDNIDETPVATTTTTSKQGSVGVTAGGGGCTDSHPSPSVSVGSSSNTEPLSEGAEGSSDGDAGRPSSSSTSPWEQQQQQDDEEEQQQEEGREKAPSAAGVGKVNVAEIYQVSFDARVLGDRYAPNGGLGCSVSAGVNSCSFSSLIRPPKRMLPSPATCSSDTCSLTAATDSSAFSLFAECSPIHLSSPCCPPRPMGSSHARSPTRTRSRSRVF